MAIARLAARLAHDTRLGARRSPEALCTGCVMAAIQVVSIAAGYGQGLGS